MTSSGEGLSIVSTTLPLTLIIEISYLQVQGSADYPYLITLVNKAPVSCSCPDFVFRKPENPTHICKHMMQVHIDNGATVDDVKLQ